MESSEKIEQRIQIDKLKSFVFKNDSSINFEEKVNKSKGWLVRESSSKGLFVISCFSSQKNTFAEVRFGYNASCDKWVVYNDTTTYKYEDMNESKIFTDLNTFLASLREKTGHGFELENLIQPSEQEQSPLCLLSSIKNNPIDALKVLEQRIQIQIEELLKDKNDNFFQKLKRRRVTQAIIQHFSSWVSTQQEHTDLEDIVSFNLLKCPHVLSTGIVLSESSYTLVTECPITGKAIEHDKVLPLSGYKKTLERCLKKYYEWLVLQQNESFCLKKQHGGASEEVSSINIIALSSFVKIKPSFSNGRRCFKVYFETNSEGEQFAEEIANHGIKSLNRPGELKTVQPKGSQFVVYLTETDYQRLKKLVETNQIDLIVAIPSFSTVNDHAFFTPPSQSNNDDLLKHLSKEIIEQLKENTKEGRTFLGNISFQAYWDMIDPQQQQQLLDDALGENNLSNS